MSENGSKRIDCDEARSLAFEAEAVEDHRELDDEKRAALERHLDVCSACRTYRRHLGGMLDGARSSDPVEWGSRDDDELFEAVVDELDGDAASGGVGDAGESVEFGSNFQSGPARWGAAGLAAGVLLSALGFLVWKTMSSGRTPEGSPSVASDQRERDGDGGAKESVDEEENVWASVERSEIDREKREELEIFASSGAEWRFEADERVPTIRLESGRILVEYLPESSRMLRVVADGTTVRVTGTVFYVDRRGTSTSAGVAEGRVEVERGDDDESVSLESGDRLSGDGEVEQLPKTDLEAIAARVDLESHRRKLEERREREDSKEAETPEKSEEEAPEGEADNGGAEGGSAPEGEAPEPAGAPPEQPSGREEGPAEGGSPPSAEKPDLAERAQRAMEAGNYRRAAERFERLIERVPSDHPDASTAHLDVARIYLNQLDRPERAADHLRTFVQRWPDDVAAESARRELCRLADQRDWDEPLCEKRSE